MWLKSSSTVSRFFLVTCRSSLNLWMKNFIPSCLRPNQRNLTFSCAESNSMPVFFNSTSFLQLPGQSDSDTLSVSLSFRTWNPNGLLMFTALAEGWVEVALTESKVTVLVNVTQKNTRIDISSGGKASASRSNLSALCLALTGGWSCRRRSERRPVAQRSSEHPGELRHADRGRRRGLHRQDHHPCGHPDRRELLLWR